MDFIQLSIETCNRNMRYDKKVISVSIGLFALNLILFIWNFSIYYRSGTFINSFVSGALGVNCFWMLLHLLTLISEYNSEKLHKKALQKYIDEERYRESLMQMEKTIKHYNDIIKDMEEKNSVQNK